MKSLCYFFMYFKELFLRLRIIRINCQLNSDSYVILFFFFFDNDRFIKDCKIKKIEVDHSYKDHKKNNFYTEQENDSLHFYRIKTNSFTYRIKFEITIIKKIKSRFSLENYSNKFKLCSTSISGSRYPTLPIAVIHVRKIFFQEFTRGINEEKVNEKERERDSNSNVPAS